MDINKVQLLGNVGKDPEIKHLDNGKMCRFTMATSFQWKKQEFTEWHNVVCFDERLVDIFEKFVQKGSRIIIFGEIRTRKYEKDSQEKWITEIVMPKFKGELIMMPKAGGSATNEPGNQPGNQPQQMAADDGFDDDIPF